MKICIFGCKSTTLMLASHVHRACGVAAIVTVGGDVGEKAQIADYADVRDWAAQRGIETHVAKRYDLKADSDEAFFAARDFDIGLVAGWQRLVPPQILARFRVGVFGMHGSAADLPSGRGRSPMNWALIEGRRVFYTNLFRYDAGVDSGDILDTQAFSIHDEDTAETLHYKNTLSMVQLFLKNVPRLETGQLSLRRQRESGATYYPKRNPEDSLIDWEMPLDALHRFIRAVSPPFNGAYSHLGDQRVTITRAAIFEWDTVPFDGTHAPPGTVLEVFPNGKLLVKVSGGTLIVHEYQADCLPEAGEVFHDDNCSRRSFARNRFGGHDLDGPPV